MRDPSAPRLAEGAGGGIVPGGRPLHGRVPHDHQRPGEEAPGGVAAPAGPVSDLTLVTVHHGRQGVTPGTLKSGLI